MRIQHNITAMNAYRNYTNNTSAIGKNLEKLSSGYKINRAGDDAAGLAVSQKMRLQIAGLEQAQKNAKSGISLVQTAEGALTEVHDMLERMYTIAEQSANGTYDESTDRTQLQKELDQLRTEIDRIGKTANFNGIGLFAEYESKKAADVDAPAAAAPVEQLTADDITGWVDEGLQEMVTGSGTSIAEYSFSVEDIAFAKDGVVTVGVAGKDYNVNVTKDMDAFDFAKAFEKAYKKDKLTTGTATNTFEISVDGTKITLKAKVAETVAAGSLADGFGDDVTIKPAEGSVNKLTPQGRVTQDKAGCGAEFEINNEASKADIARLNEILSKNEVEFTISVTALDDGAWQGSTSQLTLSGATALADAGYTIETSGGTAVTLGTAIAAGKLSGKETFTIKDMYGTKIADITVDLSGTLAEGTGKDTKLKLAEGGAGSGTFEADGPTDFKTLKTDSVEYTDDAWAEKINWSGDKSIDQGDPSKGIAGIAAASLNGEAITFTLTGLKDKLTVTLVNDESDTRIKDGTAVYVGTDTTGKELLGKIQNALNKQLKAQNETSEMAGEDYTKVSNITLGYEYEETTEGMTGYKIKGTYENTQMTYTEPEPEAPTQSDGPAKTASDIWFAIGAEANDNNKLTLGTMHLGPTNIGLEGSSVKSADISGLDISSQQGGWDAMAVIEKATNAVSDMRGTLGAIQNRLDHTINNLSVMQENMQDAESVIRDTDVAEEMMAYTKNNILVQSAQAMLAQANQLPQGVLQLLG